MIAVANRRTRSRRALAIWIVMGLVVVASLGVAIVRGSGVASPGARIVSLEKQVRCPSCGNLAVYNAKTASAYSIAGYIQHEVKAGQTNQEIIDGLVASYGDSILMAPPTSGVGLFLWLLPLGVAVALGVELYRVVMGRNGSVVALQGQRIGSTSGAMAAPNRSSLTKAGVSSRRWRPSRRLAQVGAALVLVGLGAGGALLVTGSQSSTSSKSSVASELTSAEALSALGDQKAALVQFEAILKVEPLQPSALAYEGWIRFNTSRAPQVRIKAYRELSTAVTLAPQLAIGHLFYGLALYYGKGNAQAGVDQLTSFLGDRPSKSLIAQAASLAAPAYRAAGRKVPATFGVVPKRSAKQ
ncbi:MAG: cytochrome c-type biogenesis protein CcmH [Ferrimicrobium sp.]